MTVNLVLAFGLLAVCSAQSSSSICPSCAFTQNLTLVKIPEPMSYDDYSSHVVGYQWSEIYFVYQNPSPWDPFYNYKINYEEASPTVSLEYVVADEYTSNNTGICRKINTTLAHKSLQTDGTTKRARFFRVGENNDTTITFWSSCPSQYIWIFKCANGTSTHCERLNIELGLAVRDQGYFDTMKGLPWVSMLTDLRRETDIIFGTQDFLWAWTLGDSQFC